MTIRPLVLLLFFSLECLGQVRTVKLVIPSDSVYQLQKSDILVADTLIMNNGSKLLLNSAIPDNFLYVRHLIVQGEVQIIGAGATGPDGRVGRKGQNTGAPCSKGGDGLPGSKGLNGRNGTNLNLTVESFIIQGSIKINLNGGDGGKGGDGGNGGIGSNGTLVCKGGNGGNGANGQPGGDGGKGGNLIIKNQAGNPLKLLVGQKLFITTFGGLSGPGGKGGAFGNGGEGPQKGKGSHGVSGTAAPPGKKGESGNVIFESIKN